MKKLILLILFLFIYSIAESQDVSFEATVDRTTVGLGESFELRFVAKGGNVNSFGNFKPPDLSKFHILTGPNGSTNMQIINGVMSASITYYYVLQAKDVGNVTIGSAHINYENKEYSTKPIALNIVRTATQPNQQQSKQQQSTTQVDTRDLSQNIFLRTIVDKSKVYQGEQVNVSFKLYISDVGVSNYTVSKTPSLKGFWSEEYTSNQQITLGTENVNGRMYKVGVIRRIALFPTQSGQLEVDPMEMNLLLQVRAKRSNSVFDQFFGDDPFFNSYTNIQHEIKSPVAKITVLPLPTDNVPISFRGSVGRYNIESSISTLESKTNEPVTLKLNIKGEGNIKLIETPSIELPPGIEKYEPKINDNLNKGNVISGNRKFEYLFIPRYPGEKIIPPIEFSYFDLAKKSYVTLKTPEYKLNVGQGSQFSTSDNIDRGDIKILNEDIYYIQTNSSIKEKSSYFYESPMYYILYLMVVASMFVALYYRKKNDKDLSDMVGFKMRRANKVAVKRLSKAKKLMDASDFMAFYKEISLAVWGYLSDKLKIQQAELSIEKVVSVLTQEQVDEELIAEVKKCLELCDFARFAPNSETFIESQKVYDEIKNVIVILENSLKIRV
jgi:hypothetical protein